MRLRSIAGLVAWLAFAAAPAFAQALSAQQILEKLEGRWVQQNQASSCEAGAVQIRFSSDKMKATVENWPVGETTIYEARRVEPILRVGQRKPAGAVSLIDLSAAPPVFLMVSMSEANSFSLSSAMKPSDQPVVFVRCQAEQ